MSMTKAELADLTKRMIYAVQHGYGRELLDPSCYSISKCRTVVDADGSYREYEWRWDVRFTGNKGSLIVASCRSREQAQAHIKERCAVEVPEPPVHCPELTEDAYEAMISC
jgi:hypothetical protein